MTTNDITKEEYEDYKKIKLLLIAFLFLNAQKKFFLRKNQNIMQIFIFPFLSLQFKSYYLAFMSAYMSKKMTKILKSTLLKSKNLLYQMI